MTFRELVLEANRRGVRLRDVDAMGIVIEEAIGAQGEAMRIKLLEVLAPGFVEEAFIALSRTRVSWAMGITCARILIADPQKEAATVLAGYPLLMMDRFGLVDWFGNSGEDDVDAALQPNASVTISEIYEQYEFLSRAKAPVEAALEAVDGLADSILNFVGSTSDSDVAGQLQTSAGVVKLLGGGGPR